LVALALVAAGCSTVEGTGRRQLILVSESQEEKLGLEAYEEILSKEKLSTDKRMNAVLQRVGKRIAEQADRPDFEWEFKLIESDQVNAFCLPGGKIAVYTGILPIMRNEAGLAMVMGHEVAHATARHGAERMSHQMAAKGMQQVLEYGLEDATPETQKMTMAVFGVGASVGVLLPYSRTHESEADRIGLTYAAKAGYDPHEAVHLWERMRDAGGKKPPEFLSTHPREEHRIADLEEQMPEAVEEYEDAAEQYGLGEEW
jgi:predicted Zn-dependent protease